MRRFNSLFWRLSVSYGLIIFSSLLISFILTDQLEPVIFKQFTLPREEGHIHLDGQYKGLIEEIHTIFHASSRRTLIISFVVSLLLATIFSFLITNQIVAPLKHMQDLSKQISKGDYTQRLSENYSAELDDLAMSFNTMASKLERSESQRIELMRNYAHEFRTPLSALQGNLQGLTDGLFEADDATLSACNRQVQRLVKLLDDLTLLSKVESSEIVFRHEIFDLQSVAEECRSVLEKLFYEKGVKLDLQSDKIINVLGDAERTGQVLINLLSNALRHTPNSGTVTVRLSTEQHHAIVSVIDTGEGIPDESLSHIFSRFYRADNARQHKQHSGSGIGLTISKHLINAQQGEIWGKNNAQGGCTFWFTLPLA